MGFFKKISFPSQARGTLYKFSVKCKRCDEIIQGQVDVNNEPSLELGEKGIPFYTCRKVLIGNGHCFQQVEVLIRFDESRRLLDRIISDGEFVTD